MRGMLVSLLLMTATQGLRAEPVVAASDDGVAAIALPETQLRGMLARLLFTTQSMAVASYSLGIPESCSVTRPAFEAAVQKTLPKWRRNLVEAYKQNVPADVLRRAVDEGAALASITVMPYLSKIGSQMQSKSEPLLKDAAYDVLTSVSNASSKVNIGKVNGERRKIEMQNAKEDGSLFCGLQTTGSEKL